MNPFRHRFYGPNPMVGCCCGPSPWHQPTKQERLKWLESWKEELERELREIETELGKMKKEET